MVKSITKIAFCVILVSMLFNCSEKIKIDKLEDYTEKVFQYTFNKSNPIGSGPYKIFETQDSLFVFTDFFARSIFRFNKKTHLISRIGGNGRGPGEYLLPFNLQKISDTTFAFSDGQNSLIKVFDISGNEIEKISHQHGGGIKFAIKDNILAILAKNQNQLDLIDRSTEKIKSLIKYESSYGHLSRHFDGGGIFIANSKVHLMNPIQPKIFVYDINSETTTTIDLKELHIYRNNIDKNLLSKINYNNSKKFLDKFNNFRFEGLKINNKIFYLVNVKDNVKQNLLYIFNENGKIINYFDENLFVLNTQNNCIYVLNTKESNSGQEIELINFELKIKEEKNEKDY